MPELPDVTVYVERLEAHVVGRTLQAIRLRSPFLLRSVEPPLKALEGCTVGGVRRLGKRVVFEFIDADSGHEAGGQEDALFAVLHLMIAGRLRWKKPGAGLPGKMGLAAFDFEHGTLVLTEAGTKKRASLHVVRGEAALANFNLGGLEVMSASSEEFAAALRAKNHTFKRALTDPRILSGIGNAYSDEILHRARLSPFKQTAKASDADLETLRQAVQDVLAEWTDILRAEVGEGFPDKVTAFRADMAVHGKYGKPCPVCASAVQRILYAENEANYCATCQTGGKLLADRVMSRLLKDDWPKTLEELEQRRATR